MKTLITGGSGILGKEIQQIYNGEILAPSSLELNLLSDTICVPPNIDLVIHCAAYTNVVKAEQDQKTCFQLNVLGTQKLLKQVKKINSTARFVYISTDYVFNGESGNYKEEDTKSPINVYGMTKSLAEEEVYKEYLQNFLIIRTSFKPKTPWKYTHAFTDVYTSADYVDLIAPLILEASLDNTLTGVIHIGTDVKSVYELAQSRNPQVKPTSIDNAQVSIPKNPFLCLTKWKTKSWKT